MFQCLHTGCNQTQYASTGLCAEHTGAYYERNRPVDIYLTPTSSGWVMDVYVSGVNAPLNEAAIEALHHRFETPEEAAANARRRYGERIQTLEKVTDNGLRPMVY